MYRVHVCTRDISFGLAQSHDVPSTSMILEIVRKMHPHNLPNRCVRWQPRLMQEVMHLGLGGIHSITLERLECRK